MRNIIAVLVGVSFASGALAQTCASPIAITSNNQSGTFAPGGSTTCGAENALPTYPGGIASPQPDIVHSFVAQGANATITLDATGSPLIPGLLVMDACNDTAKIVAANTGAAGASISVSLSGLTDGTTYYAVVTTAPGSPDDNCGAFGGTITGQLPVELTTFSVE